MLFSFIYIFFATAQYVFSDSGTPVISYMLLNDGSSLVKLELESDKSNKHILVEREFIIKEFENRFSARNWYFKSDKEQRIFATTPNSHIPSIEVAIKKRSQKELKKIQDFLISFCGKKSRNMCNEEDRGKILDWLKESRNILNRNPHVQIVNEPLKRILRRKLESNFKVGKLDPSYSQLAGYFTTDFEIKEIEVASLNLKVQQHLMSQTHWTKVMGYNPSYFSSKSDCTASFRIINGVAECSNFPVESVTYKDVEIFVDKINLVRPKSGRKFRLPNLDEAQAFAKADSDSDTIEFENPLDQIWFGLNSNMKTHPVDSKPPNKWEIYDTFGHLWQFVAHKPKILGLDPINDNKPEKRRYEVRGGGWLDPSINFNIKHTAKIFENWNCYDVGFRLVSERTP